MKEKNNSQSVGALYISRGEMYAAGKDLLKCSEEAIEDEEHVLLKCLVNREERIERNVWGADRWQIMIREDDKTTQGEVVAEPPEFSAK